MERPDRCPLSEKARLVDHRPAAVTAGQLSHFAARPASVTPDLLSRIALLGAI